jgi:hypothetical protein
MTEKRFVAIGVEWTDGFIQDHISDRDLFNIGAVCNLLNELSEENEQLKADNNRLVNETAKIVAEHQRKVFKLIDNNINEYIYKEKLYKLKGKDREASVFNLYCFCLNNLKKELSE